jgi:hypothetical protein
MCWVLWDRVLQTICPGWLRTVILLISASRVARIMGLCYLGWLGPHLECGNGYTVTHSCENSNCAHFIGCKIYMSKTNFFWVVPILENIEAHVKR